ncbi:hypothetical protein J6590_006602 [Homalodisca vitripennis]|nr:hypothetical protein J6590_006602 [Homalodisca vitripennis]
MSLALGYPGTVLGSKLPSDTREQSWVARFGAPDLSAIVIPSMCPVHKPVCHNSLECLLMSVALGYQGTVLGSKETVWITRFGAPDLSAIVIPSMCPLPSDTREQSWVARFGAPDLSANVVPSMCPVHKPVVTIAWSLPSDTREQSWVARFGAPDLSAIVIPSMCPVHKPVCHNSLECLLMSVAPG